MLHRLWFWLTPLVWVLAACGGGGGGSEIGTTSSSAMGGPAAQLSATSGLPDNGTLSTAAPASESSLIAVAAARRAELEAIGTASLGDAAAVFPRLTHIVHMGQSLGAGQDAFPLLSAQDTGSGNLRFARGVHTWRMMEPEFCKAPAARPESDFALVPLTSGDPVWNMGETIGNGLADQLKTWLPNSATQFIFSYAGQGSRRLRELDKRHDMSTDPRGRWPGPGGYYATSIDDIRRAKLEAQRRGFTYGVGAITWMQGEAEDDLKLYDWTPAESAQTVIDRYATDLINLKNDYNDDIAAITGQRTRVPLFSYQTMASVAGTAQLLASDRDPEIFVTSPLYYLPNAVDAQHMYRPAEWGSINHPTADGQRWLGAQFAKVIRRVMVQKQAWKPLRPVRVWASPDRMTVYVRYSVPRPPLQIDTTFLPAALNRGFTFSSGTQVRDVATVDGETLAVSLASPLPAGAALGYAVDGKTTELFTMPSPIVQVRAGARWPNGQESFEVVFAGDHRGLFGVVLANGSFFLSANSSSGPANGIIRQVTLDASGNTVLRGEVRDLDRGVRFEAGHVPMVRSLGMMGNVRDSDDEVSMHTFATGPRKGQRYPLWNWSVAFKDLRIE